MSNVGFRIRTRITRPPQDLIERFRGIPVANIADNLNRMFCIDAGISAMNNAPLLGTAFTVKTRPGDNLLLHKAIDMAAPGDIIIVDAQGETVNSLIGELMILWAQRRGIAGFVIDGAVRDSGAIRNFTIPVYAAGVTPMGPYKDGPGEINEPVSCGNVVILPGDIIVGDEDGVVVIRPAEAENVLAKAQATIKKEAEIMEAIGNGTWDRTWVDKALKEKGCEFVD